MRFAAYGCLLLTVVLLAACGAPPTPTPPPPTVTLPPTVTAVPLGPTPTPAIIPDTNPDDPSERGFLRIVQAAPESRVVDVYLESAVIAGQLGLGVFTGATAIEPGSYYLQVVPTGARINSQILADATIDLAPKQSLIVLITGTADALSIAIYEEDLSEVVTGQSRITFIHAVPRGAAVMPQIGDRILEVNLDFGQSSPPALLDAEPQRLAFISGDEVLVEVNTVIAEQRNYTAILVGQTGGGDDRILLFSDPIEAPGQIQFIHAAPELGPVDVYLNDEVILPDAGYQQSNAWVSELPGTYRIRVVGTGNAPSDEPLADVRLSLGPNRAVQAILFEEYGRPALRVVNTSLEPTTPGRSRLVVFNAISSVPVAYPQVGDAAALDIPSVSYGNATSIIDLPAGVYNLLWLGTPGDISSLVEFTGEYDFLAGYAYTYILTGAEQNPFILREVVGLSEAAAALVEDRPPNDSNNAGPQIVSASGDTVQVRAVNALSDNASIRARLGDADLAARLPSGEASSYSTLPIGDYTLRVSDGGSSPNTAAYLINDVPLQIAGTRYSLYVYGPADTARLTIVEDANRTIQQGQALLRVFHAAPGAPLIYLTIDLPGIDPTGVPATPTPVGTPIPVTQTPPSEFSTYQSPGFGLGEITDFITLPQNTYDILIHSQSNSEVIAIVPRLMLESRKTYDLILVPGTSESTLDVHLLVGEG